MTTISEVAKRAKVSVGTVSNVLAGSPRVGAVYRERVLAAIRELDYHPNHVARSLKVRQTKMLGMIVSDITNPFFPQLIRGAEDAALDKGYVLVTCNTDDRIDRERQLLSIFRARRVDGLLLVVAPGSGDVSHIRATLEAGMPVVCVDRVPEGIRLDCVSTDHVKGAAACIRHLLHRGHRRIGIITGPRLLQSALDRLKGYKTALQEANVEVEPDLISEGDFRTESGYRLTKELALSGNRPTALFVSNGMMALGAMKALDELRLRCPEDMAVAAFDDLPLAEAFTPHLTVVAQPAYDIGSRGAQLLIHRIENAGDHHSPSQVLLQPELKIRESTGLFL